MILLLALALLALCATAASASTTVSYDPATGALVQGDGAGEGVQITTLSGPDRLEVARSTLDGRVVRATLVPGNGCQAGGTDIDGQITSVRCQLTSNRIVTANLGDGADGFRSEPGQPISIAGLFIDGGGGDDLVTGVGTADQIRGGAGNDQLSPGGGNDVVEGGDGNDRLAGDSGGTEHDSRRCGQRHPGRGRGCAALRRPLRRRDRGRHGGLFGPRDGRHPQGVAAFHAHPG